MGRSTAAVRRRVNLELGLMALLLAGLAAVLLWPEETEAEDEVSFSPSVRLEYAEGKYAMVEYGAGSSNDIDADRFQDPDKKTGRDLAEFAEIAWENQWGYVWGAFGQVLDEEGLSLRLTMYPVDVGAYEQIIREKWMGRRVADCMGLIKGYCWYDPATGSIGYATSVMPDIGTEDLFAAATVTGPLETIPETPGLIVYAQGHVGVYIGDGQVIEALCTEGGVVKTELTGRNWTHWLECPYIEYE